MGTGSIDTSVSTTDKTVLSTYINKILSALIGSFVGRNSSGDAEAGQDLGTITYPWGTSYIQDLNVTKTFYKGDYSHSHPLGPMSVRTWTQATTNMSSKNIFSAKFSDELKIWVIAGADGQNSYSYNGIDWTAGTVLQPGITTFQINSIGYSDSIDKFVLIGFNSSTPSNEYGYYSSDGISWTQIVDVNFAGSRGICNSETDGKFLAVGDAGGASSSTDGINWSAVTIGVGGGSDDAYSCVYAENQTLYVVGSGSSSTAQIAYSTDLSSWTVITPSQFNGSYVTSIAYSETLSRFVACDDNGDLCYSSNGIVWTQSNVTGGGASLYVTYSEYLNIFIASGDTATPNPPKFSLDGIYWLDAADTGFAGTQINGVAISEYLGLFLTIGNAGKAAYSL